MRSIVNVGQSDTSYWLNSRWFSDVKANSYWSSSSYVDSAYEAWIVDINNGIVSYRNKNNEGYHYVWPVRSGQAGKPISWGSSKIAALFSEYGSDSGTWSHNGSSWNRLTDWPPTQMISYGTTGIMSSFNDYGSGNGLYRYDGLSWSRLTDWIPKEPQP